MERRHNSRGGRGAKARAEGSAAAIDLARFLQERYREDEQAGRELWPGEARILSAVVQRCLNKLEHSDPHRDAYERALRQFGNRYAHHPHYCDEWRP